MDKSTLSNYGWVVIVTLVLAVMLALATPFGSYVGKGASNVIKTFANSSKNAIDEDNIDTESDNWDKYLIDNEVNHALGIHEGGSYTTVDGETVNSAMGDGTVNFPSRKPQVGDTYVYGDYEYKYGYELNGGGNWPTSPTENFNGWGVKILEKTKESYGVPLKTINGKPILSFHQLFYQATKLNSLPEGFTIYDTVVNISGMFRGCQYLSKLPDSFAIPSSVKYMKATFAGCKTIENIPHFQIPYGVTSIESLFHACEMLKLPDINIPSTVTDCTSAFKYTIMTKDIVIPKTVTNIHEAFAGIVPQGKTIIIHAENLTNYRCFSIAFDNSVNADNPIKISGTSPYLQDIVNSTSSGYVVIV